MLGRYLQRFRSSDFLINVTKLTSGTTIAQIISMGTAPILYRVYDKEHYGTLGLYMAITGVIGVFSTMQYLQTILLEKEDFIAINALWLNRIINFGFAFTVFFILILFYPYLINLLNNPSINKWIWFIPVSVFFVGQNEIFKVWANRKQEYNLLTYNAITLALINPIFSIGLGFLLKGEAGLFIGLLIGQMIPAIILFIGLHNKYQLGFYYFSKDLIKHLAIKYKQFPIFSLPSEFVNRFTNQLPVFMIYTFTGGAAVGVYNLCVRMLSLPVSLIGGAISTVYQQKATQDFQEKGNCVQIFNKTAITLGFISIVPTIVILLFGPGLFTFFFGAKWVEAGLYARIFIIMFMLQLIVSPLSYIFFIRQKLKLDFMIHLLIMILLILSYYFGLKYLNINWALILHSVSYSIIYLFYFVLSKKFSKG